MEENELRENEIQENEVQEIEVQENEIQENEVQENNNVETTEVQETEKKPVDWEERNFGSKSKDLGVIGFLVSQFISYMGQYLVQFLAKSEKITDMAKMQRMASIATGIYIYVPLSIGLAGAILSIIGLIKSKSKWDSVVGLLLNLMVISTSILLIIQVSQSTSY